MSSTVSGLVYDARDAKAAATFWAAALGRTVAEGANSDNAMVDVAASGPFGVELAHLNAISAEQLHEVHDGGRWVTLADSEGNESDLIEGRQPQPRPEPSRPRHVHPPLSW